MNLHLLPSQRPNLKKNSWHRASLAAIGGARAPLLPKSRQFFFVYELVGPRLAHDVTVEGENVGNAFNRHYSLIDAAGYVPIPSGPC